jgi:hypothetical protein
MGSRRKITRALSIRQPFVEQILRGQKLIEFRNRPTEIRERVYIYASRSPSRDEPAWRAVGMPIGSLPVGAVLGSVEIVGCRFNGRAGTYEWLLRASKRLRHPLIPRNHPQPVFWRPNFSRS